MCGCFGGQVVRSARLQHRLLTYLLEGVKMEEFRFDVATAWWALNPQRTAKPQPVRLTALLRATPPIPPHPSSGATPQKAVGLRGSLAQRGRRVSASSLVADAKLAFQTYDANRSGTIDQQELATLLKDMGMTVDDGWFSTMCKRYDANETGEFEFEEFVKIYNEIVADLGGEKKDGGQIELLVYNLEL
jgi:hypothetical protein